MKQIMEHNFINSAWQPLQVRMDVLLDNSQFHIHIS